MAGTLEIHHEWAPDGTTMTDMATHKRNFRHGASGTELRNYPWQLLLIAAPAAVAIWSGWVGLGSMCGFGPVNLLPGFGSGLHLNTAITLPVGIEAYGVYAMFAWLALKNASDRTRDFARKSAVAALVLGCLGQITYHLMAAAGWARAPWYVVMLVSCLPVATVYFAATLTHLIVAGRREATKAREAAAETERAGAEAAGAELAALRDTLETERAAREAAEAETGTVRAELAAAAGKAEAATRKLAASIEAQKRKRKPAATRRPEAVDAVDLDAEARILKLIEEGNSPSKAGVLAGHSDSYGRQVARKARELAAAAPKGQDPEE